MVAKTNKVRKLKEKKEIGVDISTRHLEKALTLIDRGLDAAKAVVFGILNDCQLDGDRRRIEKIITIS